MMKNLAYVLICLMLLTSCKQESKQAESTNLDQTEQVAETPLIAIADFDNKAGEFVSKEVKVKGIVDHVCKHGGKKLLLVTDDGNVHVTSDSRFEEDLVGSEIALNGVVAEERIDEAYLLKMEEDNIKNHSEGQSSDEQFEARKKHIKEYRDQMKANKTDHISNYSLEYVSHVEIQ